MNSNFYESAFDSGENPIIIETTLEIDEMATYQLSNAYDSEVSTIDTGRESKTKCLH